MIFNKRVNIKLWHPSDLLRKGQRFHSLWIMILFHCKFALISHFMVDLTTYCVFKWDYFADKTEILVKAVRLTAMENDFSFHNSEQVHLPWQARTSTNHTCSGLHPDSGEKPLHFPHKTCYPWMISPFCLFSPLQYTERNQGRLP